MTILLVSSIGNAAVLLRSEAAGKYLGTNEVFSEQEIVLKESSGVSSATLWEMIPVSENGFVLRNVLSAYYLTYNEDESVGASLDFDADDYWEFLPNGETTLIRNVQSGRYLWGAAPGVETSTEINIRVSWMVIEADSFNSGLGELFDDLYDKVLKWEAFSAPKDAAWGSTFESRVEEGKLRERFLNVNSAPELLGALNAISCARRDHHLRIEGPLPFGYAVAPISFLPDFSDSFLNDISKARLFVSKVGKDEAVALVTEGDELITVNGQPLADYLQIMIPEYRMSMLAQGLVRWIGPGLAEYHEFRSSELYREDGKIHFGLLRNDSSEYEVTVGYDYVDFDLVDWRNPDPLAPEDFQGYSKVVDNIDLELWVPNPENQNGIVIIRWMDFEEVEDSLAELMDYAELNDYLGHDVIFDATISGGGSGAPLVIQRLTSTPFLQTFGNVRCTELSLNSARRFGSKARTWIEESCATGLPYTSNEPFKLIFSERGSDGILLPEDRRFRGKVLGLFFPYGGSNLDQLSAMFIDNRIGPSMGLPAGGFSNTWEGYDEVLGFDFPFSIGHTIRPNGEVLEGNPAVPDIRVPMTKENFKTYFKDLVDSAIAYLIDHPVSHDWAREHFGEDISLDVEFWSDDPDLDQLPNAIEFVSNTYPEIPTTGPFVFLSNGILEWRTENTPKSMVLERSSDLDIWTQVESWFRPSPRTYRTPIDGHLGPSDEIQFFRIKVEL